MARKKKKKEAAGSPAWMTTFSDLMSLLLTFFILLFSMSSVSGEKFASASQSIQAAFAGTGSGSILDGSALYEEAASGQGGSEAAQEISPEVLAMYEEVMKFIEEHGVESQVTVSRDKEGIYLDIQESILFESGRAEVTESGKGTLDIMSDLLKESDNDIVVEGYTDDIPMSTYKYPSNWELSAGRALSVVRYLAEEKELDPSRLSAKGYGEYSPSVPNDIPENRAKNRRVNIVIVYEPEEGSS